MLSGMFDSISELYTRQLDAEQEKLDKQQELLDAELEMIDTETEIVDNSLAMLLRLLLACQVHSVNLAGFDGYSRTDDNYFDQSFEYSFSKEKADYLNAYMCDFLKEHEQELYVSFLTDSVYSL